MTTAHRDHPDPILTTVRVLAAARDHTQAEVILGSGIPKSTFMRRQQQGGWTVAEVRSLAGFLKVEPAVLLRGPSDLFREGVLTTTSGFAGGNRAVFDSAAA